MERQGKVWNSPEVETFFPPPEYEDFLLDRCEQQCFKANLFLLLSLYRKETGRRVPAVLLQWFEMELNEMSERASSIEWDCGISSVQKPGLRSTLLVPGCKNASVFVAAGCLEDDGKNRKT